MNRRHNAFSLAICALVFAGCGAAPPYAALAIENDAELTSNVVVADAKLHDILRVGPPFVERVQGTNQLRVTVALRNIDDEPIQILAQTSFLNSRKQPIGDDTNKQVKLIAPGDTITHVAISKQAEAMDWVLRISWNQ